MTAMELMLFLSRETARWIQALGPEHSKVARRLSTLQQQLGYVNATSLGVDVGDGELRRIVLHELYRASSDLKGLSEACRTLNKSLKRSKKGANVLDLLLSAAHPAVRLPAAGINPLLHTQSRREGQSAQKPRRAPAPPEHAALFAFLRTKYEMDSSKPARDNCYACQFVGKMRSPGDHHTFRECPNLAAARALYASSSK